MPWSITALVARGERFTVADVLAAALLEGTLDPEWSRVEAHLALDGNPSPDPSVLSHEVRAWRMARRLSSADDTRAWLARHHLDLAHLGRFVARGRRFATSTPCERRAAPQPKPEAVADALPAALCFEGVMPRWVEAFALRVVAPEPRGTAPLVEHGRRNLEIACARWGLDRLRMERLRRVVAAHLHAAEALRADGAVEAELARSSWSFDQVTVAVVRAPSEGVARELLARLREDAPAPAPGALEQEARLHGLPVERSTTHLADVEGPVRRARLAAARPGELVGPERIDGAFRVTQLLARHPAKAADPGVRARALEAAVLRARRVDREDHVDIRCR